MTTHITIGNDPQYWGSDGTGDVDAYVERVSAAAEAAGVDVRGHTLGYYEDADDEINWWDEWCGGGYRWNRQTWAAWFRRNS